MTQASFTSCVNLSCKTSLRAQIEASLKGYVGTNNTMTVLLGERERAPHL